MSIPKLKQYDLSLAITNVENKSPWEIDPSRAVLLVHDMQNYFVNFYEQQGQMMDQVVQNIVTLKKQCEQLSVPVYYTAQPGDQDQKERALLVDFWGPGLGADENKPDVISALTPNEKDVVLTKHRYSAFKKSDFLKIMQDSGKDQIIICGVYAHIGILSTALDAFMYDIKPFVISDAVADFSLEDHQMAMKFVSQRCGNVYQLNELLSQLPQQHSQQNPQEQSNNNELTLTALVQDVATVLSAPIEEIEVDEEFMYLGLDSVRMMSLIQKWNDKGWQGDFAKLAQATNLQELYEALKQEQSAEPA